MTADLSSTLAGIRERYDEAAEGLSPEARKYLECADVPPLVAAIDAVLKLADEWEDSAAIIDPATPLREAISTALTGQETGDA